MEALFYGVPVVFPMIDGQPEVVEDGVCGVGIVPDVAPEAHQALTGINVNFPYDVYSPEQDRLVSPMLMDHHAVANAVIKIAGDDYATWRANAFAHVAQHFDYKNFISEFNATILEVVDENNKK